MHKFMQHKVRSIVFDDREPSLDQGLAQAVDRGGFLVQQEDPSTRR